MGRILVISHTPTHPINAGNRARVNSLLSSLQDAGHEICLYLLDFGNGDNQKMEKNWDMFWSQPYSFPRPTIDRRIRNFISKSLKVDLYKPFKLDEWCHKTLNLKLQQLKQDHLFDVVLVEYVFFSKVFDCFQDALKILDTHDIFGDRHKLFLEHGKQPSWFYTTPEEEGAGLKRADAVLAIQEQEKAYFSALSPGTNVLTVGHIARIVPPSSSKAFFNRLLFIASGNDVNIDALNYFLDDIWPEIRKRSPESKLDIVGNICRQLKTLPKGCHAVGEIDDLGDCYATADVVVNPVRFGTGLKIKNIESLGYGMPLVTTGTGAEGLESGVGKAFLVANDQTEFVENICTLLSDGVARQNLSKAALEFAKTYNDQATKPLLGYIDRALSVKRSPQP